MTARELTDEFQPTDAGASFLGRSRKFAAQFFRQRGAAPALAVIGIVAFAAITAQLISPYDPLDQNPFAGLEDPSWDHPLGTDQLGRDYLSRLIYGSRVALLVGIGAVIFSAAIGVPIGLVAGYNRGFIDDLLMRLMDALVAFPGFILAMGFVAIYGASKSMLIIAIGIGSVAWNARIVRSQVLSVREQDFITAARAMGAGSTRIISIHVLPNTLAPVIVQSTLLLGFAILAEAGLSFLGLGIQAPTPTWGSMLQFGRPFMSTHPLLAIVPGLCIFFLVLAFNLLGDILRDVLDPRMRGSLN